MHPLVNQDAGLTEADGDWTDIEKEYQGIAVADAPFMGLAVETEEGICCSCKILGISENAPVQIQQTIGTLLSLFD